MFVGSADADVVEFAVVAECDGACFVDAVVSDSDVGCVACVARFGFGEPVVDGGGGRGGHRLLRGRPGSPSRSRGVSSRPASAIAAKRIMSITVDIMCRLY